MIPPPLYLDGAFEIVQSVVNTEYPTQILEIAKKTDIPTNHIIDLFTEFGGSALTCP